MKVIFYFSLCFLFFFSSCATMDVSVSVLDKNKLDLANFLNEMELDEIVPKIKKDIYERKYKKIGDELIEYSNYFIDQGVETGIFPDDETTLSNTKREYKDYIDSIIDEAVLELNNGISAYYEAKKESDIFEKNTILIISRNHINSGENLIRNLLVGGGETDKLNWGNENDLKITRISQKASTSFMESFSIFGDPFVSFVANLDEKIWEGKYNETFVKNKFGNSDVAIKMESIGNFTIKGVRLDADKAIKGTFEALNTSIEFLSKIYGGGDLTSVDNNPDSVSPPDENNQLDPSDAKKNVEFSIDKTLSRLAALSIIDVILSNKDNLNPDESPNFEKAINVIKSTIEINKSNLGSKN